MPLKLRAALIAGTTLLLPRLAFAEPVTLEEAVARAISAAPELRARDADVAAARAEQVQAGLRPNPVLSVEAENVAGTGDYSVFEQPELTVTYEQPIERGGKRAARVAVAARGIELAEAQARVTRLDLAQQVQRAFIDVQIAGQLVWIAERRLEVEKAMQTEALRRVRAYRDPLFVETRADARVTEVELAVAETKSRLEAARALLASFWGGDPASIEVPEGIEKPISLSAELAAADAAVTEAAVERANAEVVLEQSRAVQDYSVSGGARFLRETNDVALVAGVSIPLGRFDRNQGNIERARAERRRLEFEAEAARLARLRRLASLRAEAEAARMRAEGIMQDVHPKATKALEQVREGYNRGGFRFSDVQDAADAIVAVQQQWVEAMTRYRDVQSEIDRLTGRFDALDGEILP
jgi:cobalt-zinc-cadmium efflux system outer membrane protein